THGEFDHKDTRRFKHTRIGIWDLYEARQTLARNRVSSILQTYTPIIYRCTHIKRCSILLPAYLVVEVLASLIPAVSLWYVESVMEAHSMMPRLRLYIKQFYNERMLLSTVRLDLLAFQTLYRSHALLAYFVGWNTIEMLTHIAIILIRLLSCLLVLSTVMWNNRMVYLVVLSFLQYLLPWDSTGKAVVGSLVWAATTTNENLICMQGLKELITGSSHRREFVAGNFSEHISARFREASQRIGHDAVEFPELKRFRSFKDCLSITFIIRETMHVLPQVRGVDLRVDKAD
ncbi:uncharacterized protein F5147DRAFT_741352, partial [Suillus discolor]